MLNINVMKLRQTSAGHPCQWEGITDLGDYIYIRYRFGKLSIGLGPDILEAVKHTVWSRRMGNEGDGYLTYYALRMALHGVVGLFCPDVPDSATEAEILAFQKRVPNGLTLERGGKVTQVELGEESMTNAARGAEVVLTLDRVFGGDPDRKFAAMQKAIVDAGGDVPDALREAVEHEANRNTVRNW